MLVSGSSKAAFGSVRRQGGRCGARADSRGFTLTELMVVVVIMGVLASLCLASLRKHVTSARGVEAVKIIQSIRAAEERWRSEHMLYLNASTAGVWYPFDPEDSSNKLILHAFFYPPGSSDHVDADKWLQLHPTAPGAVRFGYLVNSGLAGDPMTVPTEGGAVTWPTPPDNWYVIQAYGDVDGNGTFSYYRASSIDGEVYMQNHGE